ncbi:myb-like protein P [Calliphora vicina]|uniref:myb-like protein P n=1 Tax=Calliphora vicina TaxID=7373 RepID=UPI00325B7101
MSETDISDSNSESEIKGQQENYLSIETTDNINNFDMASIEEKTKFISMCSSIIRENYNGNPLTLNSFIDKINLIEEITAPNLNTCLISFIKSKLDGKAREVLPNQIISTDQIKDILKNRIKPDSSIVVAGRIAALNIKQNNYTDFAKNVEDLADALERSLVIEGITREKAHEMAIDQTISVCRANAKSDMVKAILASTTFKEPKDVVAKLIIEDSNTENHSQVLSMRYNGNRYNFSHRNQPPMNRFTRRNNYNNRFNNNNYNGQRNYEPANNYNNRSNNNNNNSQRNYTPTNNYNNNRGRYNNRSNQAQNASIRTLNSEVPQQDELREEEI